MNRRPDLNMRTNMKKGGQSEEAQCEKEVQFEKKDQLKKNNNNEAQFEKV